MHDSFNITSPSPDTRHTARFVFSGEIRFGPSYFSLMVDSYSFGERIFGDAHRWSSSASLLAVQEWLTLDYAEGPITALVLIDLERGREATLARVTKGFVVPVTFTDLLLVYRADYGGQQGAQPVEVDATQIQDWQALATA